MVFIGNLSPDTRLPLCHYCGAVVEPGASYDVCEPCDTGNIASDLYKDEHGVRPRGWSLPELRAYLRSRQEAVA